MRSNTLKVLAVDASAEELTALRATLRELLPSTTLLTALDGASALMLATTEDPDVILLDLALPGPTGLEVCRRLKADERLKDIPLVCMTAQRTDREHRLQAVEAGADGFLSKPLDDGEVVALLRSMAKLRAAYRLRSLGREELAALVAERTRELELELVARTHVEQALRESETRYRALVAGANDGIFLISPEGDLVEVNESFARMHGWTREELQRLTLADLDTPATAALAPARIRRILSGEPLTFEVEHLHKEGHSFSLEVSSSLVHVGGNPYILAVHRDITERKRLQAGLERSDRLASLGMLAAGVAHEINNPLAYVLSNTSFAIDELRVPGAIDDPPRLREIVTALVEAVDGAHRVRRIVRDLKALSRPDEDRTSRVDVEKVLESSLAMIANEIRPRARLVRDFAGVPPIEANDARLGQVLLNLLANAAQAIPEGHPNRHEIRVSTRIEPEGRLCIEIRDTGGGIPANILARIFDPFFTTKPVGVGTGLGLAICHSLIEQMGGEILVESAVGKGTTFRVLLPTVGPSQHAAPTSEAPVLLRRGQVLVVDDEPLVGKALVRLLSREHDVTLLASARDALDRLRGGEHFDAIVCDLMMPELSGMDLHDEVFAFAPDQAQRMIFVTGGAYSTASRTFLERVPNIRLDKPINEAELRRALHTHLAERP